MSSMTRNVLPEPGDISQPWVTKHSQDGAWVALSGISGSAHSLYVKLVLLSADYPEEPLYVGADVLAGLMNLSRGDKISQYVAELQKIGAVTVVKTGRTRPNGYLVHRDPPAGFDGLTSMSAWLADTGGDVVYYVRRANGDIKIGTTRVAVSRRMTQLKRLHGEIELLATEPGGFELEIKRHRQFGLSWLGGEWFRPSDRLLAHIASCAAATAVVGGAR